MSKVENQQQESSTDESYIWVSVEDLSIHPENSEIYGGEEEDSIEDLATGMMMGGFDEGNPITAKPDGTVVKGNRRVKAARKVGIDEVPVVEKEYDSFEDEMYALVTDNITHRERSDVQKWREVQVLQPIIEEKNRKKMKMGKSVEDDPSSKLNEGNSRTAKELAERTGIGSENTYRKLDKVMQYAGESVEVFEREPEGEESTEVDWNEEEAPEDFEIDVGDIDIPDTESKSAIKEIREVAKEEVEKYLSNPEDQSPHGAWKAVKKKKEELEREQRKKELTREYNDENDGIEIRHNEFQKVDFEPESFDHIITDPPYPGDHIELWSDLSQLADEVLKPGGFCITYSGSFHLSEVMERLSENLEYYWTCILIHNGPGQMINPRNLRNGYKPVLIFQKPPEDTQETNISDVIEGTGREKDKHEWQQAKDEMVDIIERFTDVNDRILDPMVGSGTTLVAADEVNRRSMGVEKDEGSIEEAKARIVEIVNEEES